MCVSVLSQAVIAQSPAIVDCIAFIEMSRYDEATSVLGVVQPLTEDQLKAMTDSDFDNRLKAAWSPDAIKENAPSNVFQTELQWRVLLLVRHGSDLPDEYVFITSEAVIAPQVLSQTTAAAIAQSVITPLPLPGSQHSCGSVGSCGSSLRTGTLRNLLLR